MSKRIVYCARCGSRSDRGCVQLCRSCSHQPTVKPNVSTDGLVYLATPYSHDDPNVRRQRFEIVNRVAAGLMRDGVHIYSPISHTHPIAMAGDLPKGWDYWEKYGRVVLAACVKVIVLRQPGWEQSTGVNAELAIARELGLPIEFIDP